MSRGALPDSRHHLAALDGLRGVAILLVLLHGFDVLKDAHGLVHLVDMALDAGWIGVQLFFVLSGFLITGILLDTRAQPGYYRSFFVRRVLRIFPLYYGVLTVAFVVLPLCGLGGQDGRHQFWLWTYLANYAAPFGLGERVFPHFWSLCVEEQFYLAWPLVVRLAGRRGVVAVAGVLVVAAIATRMLLRAHLGEPVGHEAAYMFTPSRMDALAIGAAIAALLREPRCAAAIDALGGGAFAIAGLAVIAAGLAGGHLQRVGAAMQAYGYTVVALGFGLLLIASLRVDAVPARWLASAPLRRCGTYSYAMYVFYAPLHLLVGLPLLARFGHDGGPVVAAVYGGLAIAITFALAALSYHLYERRFLALKPRLAPLPRG